MSRGKVGIYGSGAVSPALLIFIDDLEHPLSKPQRQYAAQVADALSISQGTKTLPGLYRHIVGNPCRKAAADTFREAPWTADDLRVPLRKFLVQEAFAIAEAREGAPRLAFLSQDDSLTEKDNGAHRHSPAMPIRRCARPRCPPGPGRRGSR